MRSVLLFVVLAAAAVVACTGTSPTTTGAARFAVTGFVHAGPTCPVQSDPPAPGCEDRPVAGAVLTVLDASGDEIAEVVTGPEGTLELELPAGAYTLVPRPVAGLLGTAPPQDFVVTAGEPVALDVAYDTGIR